MGEIHLSVIIPCFNSGAYLMEAIESVQASAGERYINHEIIIVNDGSTDFKTIELLNKMNIPNVTIIHQGNKGPAAARNLGVKKSKGEFLLFLDSDNKIRENYFTKGLSILINNEEIGVVFGNPHFFGEDARPRFKPQKFDKFKILRHNYIDMCTLMKKSVWLEEGEFDEERSIIGYEDWEYWIRLSNTKWKFYFLDEICFDYRIRSDSLVMTFHMEKIKRMREYILLKHFNKIVDNYQILYNLREYETNRPLRVFTKNILRKIKEVDHYFKIYKLFK